MAHITVAEARRLAGLSRAARKIIKESEDATALAKPGNAYTWRLKPYLGLKRISPEHQLQMRILQLLREQLQPGALVYHPPNEAQRTKTMWALLYALGFIKGALDLMIFIPGGKTYFMEVKDSGKKMTLQQSAWYDWATQNGFPAVAVDNYEDAVGALVFWNLIGRK